MFEYIGSDVCIEVETDRNVNKRLSLIVLERGYILFFFYIRQKIEECFAELNPKIEISKIFLLISYTLKINLLIKFSEVFPCIFHLAA